MTTLYIVRHAESEGNLYRRFYGSYDGKLSVNGRKQLDFLRERFLSIPLDAVYSSDLTRAYQTALAISEPKGLTVIREPGLREFHLGDWEDSSVGEKEELEAELLREFTVSPATWRVPNSETFPDVQNRAVAAIKAIAAKHPGQSVAVATHGMVIRALQAYILNVDADNIGTVRYVDNTSVTVIDADENGNLTQTLAGDSSHLPTELSTFARQTWWKEKNGTDRKNIYFKPIDDGRKAEAILHGEICGSVTLDMDNYAADNAAWLVSLSLKPEYRNSGLGVQLIGYGVSYSRRHGRDKLRAIVSERDNSSVGFFVRHGFERKGEDGGAVKLEYEL
ncbi:MAG: GNAT family N-acetyltransferase [Oscillospiraceae bacterium]|jgi:probable phosphoglycerate mutase|nr:GNAT family N-acetyltransferase [Oscillospiraceae bacterium]